MSIRACIIQQNTNGSYSSIYNHNDGYIDGLGATLFKYYNDTADVCELIFEGDCSYPGSPYGDSNSKAITRNSLAEIIEAAKDVGYDYYYLFANNNGKWRWHLALNPKSDIKFWSPLEIYF